MGTTSAFLATATTTGYVTTSLPLASLPSSIAALSVSTGIMATTTSLISATSTVIAMMSASSVASMAKGHDPEDDGECQLLGPFAVFIQGALGALALLSLVYKRWRERPQRPIKIWAFDVSKQVVGSILLHVANLLMSMLSSGQLTVSPSTSGSATANPCSFYLLNLAIDTTLGIPILIILLRIFTYGFLQTPMADPPESIQSGNYGQPPKVTWWLKQCLIYFLGLLGMKCCVFFIFQICPWIIDVGNWALRWTEGNETVQVIFVMLVFPVIMNAIQYYIIDGFIKNQSPSDHEPIPNVDGSSDDEDTAIPQEEESDLTFVGAVDPPVRKESGASGPNPRVTKLKVDSDKLHEYNPDRDGDNSPTVVGSSESNSLGDDEDESLLGKSKRSSKKPTGT